MSSRICSGVKPTGTTTTPHPAGTLQSIGLVNLPPEVIIKILGMLSIREFGLLNRTCRQFCDVTTNHPLTLLGNQFFPNFRKSDPHQTDLEALKEQHFFHLNQTIGVYASEALEGHMDCVTSLSLDGQRLISGSSDGTIKIWDLNTNECTVTLRAGNGTIWSLALEGQRLFSGSVRTIKIWDLNTNECIATLEGHYDHVKSLVLEGKRLISCSYDKMIKIWDLNTNTCTTTLEGGYVTCLALDGQRLISGSSDKRIKIWDLNTNTCTTTLEGHDRPVASLAIMGERLFSGSSHGTIKIWDLNTNECVATLNGHTSTISSLALDGKRLFSSSYDNTIKIWDLSSNTCTSTLQGHIGPVHSLALDGHKLFSGSDTTGTIKIWDFSAPNETIFNEIAVSIESQDPFVAQYAMQRFERMPLEDKNAIYGELYHIMAPVKDEYPGCAQDAFHNRNEQSSSPEQRAQAILNYLEKRSADHHRIEQN
ncbi:MAG: F-box/WD repeat-containing protein [Verrucomicrobia bacterium]|nr:F-box/WD repeat-containing protein [Verrucomicrobiota bacterium]